MKNAAVRLQFEISKHNTYQDIETNQITILTMYSIEKVCFVRDEYITDIPLLSFLTNDERYIEST